MEKEHKGIYKYYYLGIPSKQYYEQNNLSYKNIYSLAYNITKSITLYCTIKFEKCSYNNLQN